MKVYILPKEANRNLLKLLFSLSTNNDYGSFIQRLGMYLKSTKLHNHHTRQELTFLLNKLYLSNIFKYSESQSYSWFIQSLKNNMLGYEMVVNPCAVGEFFKPLMGMGINDYDTTEIENLLTRDINEYLTNKYNENSASFNGIFVDLFEVFNTHIPVERVYVHRFELAPTWAPLVFCSEKNSLRAGLI